MRLPYAVVPQIQQSASQNTDPTAVNVECWSVTTQKM